MANGFVFTSYDGTDNDGIRAEVYVQRGTGTISKIEHHANGKVASVAIKTEGLRFATSAWVNLSDPTFPVLVKAYDENREVDYRVESQRKAKIPRNVPIATIRAGEENYDPKADVKSIIAGVRIANEGEMVYSAEMVTDPAEDPAPGGRISAREQNQTRNAQAASQQPTAPQNNNQPPAGGSDGRPYQRTNMDGTPNLDSFATIAAVGVEGFIRRHLTEHGWTPYDQDFPNEVYGYSMAVIAAVDSIQSYLTKRPVDRSAHSHTRIRGVAFSTIEDNPLSAVREGTMSKADWHALIGRITLNRMKMIIDIDSPSAPFNLNGFLGKEPAGAKQTENAPQPRQDERSEQQPQDDRREPESGNNVSDEAVLSARPEPRNSETPAAPTPDASNEEENIAAVMSRSTANYSIFPHKPQSGGKHEPDPVVIEGLREVMEKAGIQNAELSVLLRHTFGFGQVVEIDPDDLAEFNEFYDDAEGNNPGNMKKVVAHFEGLDKAQG